MRTGGWRVDRMDPVRDLEHVMAIDRASFARPWARMMYLAEIERSDTSRIHVVRSPAGDVVGYCVFWVVADELQIHNLAVGPRWRRRGAGQALLDYVLADAVRAGAVWATLEVRVSNRAARRLYRGAGFEVATVRRGYYSSPPDDALVMTRGLGPSGQRPTGAEPREAFG